MLCGSRIPGMSFFSECLILPYMPLNKKSRSLQILMVAVIGALIVFTWTSALRDVYRWGNAYKEANEAITANERVDAILQAGINLAFERGRTNVMLNAPTPAETADLAFIADKRTAVAETLEPILSNPSMQAIPIARTIKKEYEDLRSLRTEADSAFKIPKADRSPDFETRWFLSLSNLVDDLGTLASTVSLENRAFTTSFRTYSRMKVIAYRLRETVGISSSKIAASVSSGEGMDSEDIEGIAFLRGQSDAIWRSLRQEALISGNLAIGASISKVERELFLTLRPLQDSILSSYRLGERPKLTTKAVTTVSIPALNSITYLISILTEETQKDTLGHLSGMKSSLAASVAMAILSLALGIYALQLLVNRVLLPIEKIGDQLERLASGDYATEIRYSRKVDEMTRGYVAIAAFRDSLVKHHELEERLIKLSNSDGLTGLANRRFMDEALDAEWNRAARTGQPLAMAMIDADLFKSYNDLYGHLVGDDCLRTIAGILNARAQRAGDVVARYGGEEFAAILPNLSVERAHEWMSVVRAEIEARKIAHSGSPFGVVTVSAGVAALVPSPGSSVLELVRLADEALYRAKAEGRNKVISREAD